jgi:hypothetical protein
MKGYKESEVLLSQLAELEAIVKKKSEIHEVPKASPPQPVPIAQIAGSLEGQATSWVVNGEEVNGWVTTIYTSNYPWSGIDGDCQVQHRFIGATRDAAEEVAREWLKAHNKAVNEWLISGKKEGAKR